MTRKPQGDLRTGFTTGACATAATKAALYALWGNGFPKSVVITLPQGQTPEFPLAHQLLSSDWAEVGITKDAGDDPDVTHGALIIVRVRESAHGLIFKAGPGVGTVTKAGLPIGVGEPAINPVPRQMMAQVVEECAAEFSKSPNIEIEVSIPDGEEIALKTWNGRLGIKGGLSILGTTGIVRPFSCAAWIASIHRGIDVARAEALDHVAGCTGATSEKTVQAHFDLPEIAMLDMGDFAGGMLKYLKKHPVECLTIGGGFGKITKLAQGAMDLHSSRSQVDFDALNKVALDLGLPQVSDANTALEAFERCGTPLSQKIALDAHKVVSDFLDGAIPQINIVIIDRQGTVIGEAS